MTLTARWYRPALFLLPLLLSACGGGDSGDNGGDAFTGPPLSNVVKPEPGSGNTLMRMFVRPFGGEYPVLNYFDHDQPIHPNDTNGYQLNWRGARAFPGRDIGGYDGHKGIDWLLPENTPLFAVTGGEVRFAGGDTFACVLQGNEIVTNLTVIVGFIGPNGELYSTLYTHLNRIDVAVGDVVAEGQQIGLSGVTGCVGRGRLPHLHFEVRRNVSLSPLQNVVIDPYGWEGPTIDPWSATDSRRASMWMWKEGQAPDMVPRRPQ